MTSGPCDFHGPVGTVSGKIFLDDASLGRGAAVTGQHTAERRGGRRRWI